MQSKIQTIRTCSRVYIHRYVHPGPSDVTAHKVDAIMHCSSVILLSPFRSNGISLTISLSTLSFQRPARAVMYLKSQRLSFGVDTK